MTFIWLIVALLIQCFILWAVFFFSFSRITGALTIIVVTLLTALISPWSLILAVPLILISLVLIIDPLRMAVITKPAY